MFGDFLGDMIHTLPPPVQCFIDCQLWSISPPTVLWHTFTTLGCDQCDQVFSNVVNFKKHKRFFVCQSRPTFSWHTFTTLNCNWCDLKVFSTVVNHKKHKIFFSVNFALHCFVTHIYHIGLWPVWSSIFKFRRPHLPHCNSSVHRMTKNSDHYSLPKVNYFFLVQCSAKTFTEFSNLRLESLCCFKKDNDAFCKTYETYHFLNVKNFSLPLTVISIFLFVCPQRRRLFFILFCTRLHYMWASNRSPKTDKTHSVFYGAKPFHHISHISQRSIKTTY